MHRHYLLINFNLLFEANFGIFKNASILFLLNNTHINYLDYKIN